MIGSETTPFLETLERLFAAQANSPERIKAWESFLTRGLPDRKWDAFQYLPLRELYCQTFQLPSVESPTHLLSHILPECQKSYLVFINGSFVKELSNLEALPKSVVVLPLSDAMRTYRSFLQSRLNFGEADPFHAINTALHREGLFLFIPPKVKCEAPIQCLHLMEAGAMAIPRLHISLGAQAEATIISEVVGTASYFVNALTDVSLEDGAFLQHININFPPSTAWHFEALRATLKQKSRYSSIHLTSGGKSVRQDLRIALNGEGAEANLQGISMLDQHKNSHTHVLIDHAAPHTRSQQLFKNVLNDHSQASFQGKIYVQRQAQKTEAYQLNNNLLLGERAIANSKPNLEIFADDVKASHGATTAKLKEDLLFYLRTRGISEETAKTLLVKAFCQAVIDPIPIPSVKQKMTQFLNEYLSDG